MREFKFRIWDHLVKGFSYVDIRNIFGHLPADIPNNQIQQFTGLKDKNGKEIYEGDYINFSYTGETIFTGFVRWFNDRASFGVTVDNAFETFEELLDYWEYVEVVGNVFENLEKLDQSSNN